jgi:hypothetical protein
VTRAGRTALARFLGENFCVQAQGLERAVTDGAESVRMGVGRVGRFNAR